MRRSGAVRHIRAGSLWVVSFPGLGSFFIRRLLAALPVGVLCSPLFPGNMFNLRAF